MTTGPRLAATMAAGVPIVAAGIWGTLFVWYRMPGGTLVAAATAAAWTIASLAALAALRRARWRWAAGYAAAFAGLVAWFMSIPASGNLDWAPDVSRPLRAEIAADRVTVADVRDFRWRTDEDYTPGWTRQTYDLAGLRSVDLINSYWAGPVIAHTLISFGFQDGRHLAFSIEIRRRRDQEFSSVAGFFREYELVFVAAEERDIVRLRSNVRREDAQLYRVKASPEQARGMFLELLRRANALADRPAWYNSLTTNCTTEMFGAAHIVAPGLPFDWRIIVSGYLPEYAYDQGILDTRQPFSALRDASHIASRAIAADADPDFSARIREGVPDPNR